MIIAYIFLIAFYNTYLYFDNLNHINSVNNISKFSLHCVLLYAISLLFNQSNFSLHISMISLNIILQAAATEYYKFIMRSHPHQNVLLEILNILIISGSLYFTAFNPVIYIMISNFIIMISYIFIKSTILQYYTASEYCVCYNGCSNGCSYDCSYCILYNTLYKIYFLDIHLMITIIVCLVVTVYEFYYGGLIIIYSALSNYITILFIKMITLISSDKCSATNAFLTYKKMDSLIFPNIAD